MNPTIEQRHAIDMAMQGQSCKVTAYAGAGKTSTLKLIGNAKYNQHGMYLAFNKAIATEAQSKFNQNVKCKTFHSLAYNSVPRWLTNKLKNRRLMSNQLAYRHNLENYHVPVALVKQRGEDDKKRLFNSKHMANAMMNAVGYFYRSNYDCIQMAHVYAALPDWMDDTYRAELANVLLPKAHDYWSDVLHPTGVNRLEHDHYLKYWALSNPVINSDFILFDEAQDADLWCPEIDVTTGVIKNWEAGKTAAIHYKVTDCCGWELLDQNNNVVMSQVDGYVPETLSPAERGYGDYIIMNISENGQIDKWCFDIDDFQGDEE